MKRILATLLLILISQIYAELHRGEESAVVVDSEQEQGAPHVLNVEDAYKPKKGHHQKAHGMHNGKHKGKSQKTPKAVGASVGVGASCSGGTCQDKSTTACSGGSYVAGLCPGPSNVQCCQKAAGVGASCSGGTCQLTSTPCSGGSYHAGLCPGAANVQCCVKSSGGGGGGSSSDARRQSLINCGQALYNNRYSEHYSEGSNRWMGIQNHIMPPSAPTYSDCSSSVSWCYWTVFGNGPDILNGDNWQGGYTGTMAEHGTEIPCSQMQPGDIALYGSGYPWDHTEMYMGGGLMVSHGADPVSYQSSSSTQGFATMQCRSYF